MQNLEMGGQMIGFILRGQSRSRECCYMPQLKAAQELLFTSNDDPPERGVKITKFSVNLVSV